MRDDAGQSRLAQPGGAVKEDMVESFFALLRRLNIDLELRLDLALSVEIGQFERTQAAFLKTLDLLLLRRQFKAAGDFFLIHRRSPRQRGWSSRRQAMIAALSSSSPCSA